MAIKWMEDLGAPAVVAVADIVTTEQKPTWNRPVGIGLAAIGYIAGGVMGMGGPFVKNLGIAAAPWAMESIYQYIKEATGTTSRMTMRAGRPAARIAEESHRIARSYQPEMAKATAF
jgi:hypothetical protein